MQVDICRHLTSVDIFASDCRKACRIFVFLAQRPNPWTHAHIRIRMLLALRERLEAACRLRLHVIFAWHEVNLQTIKRNTGTNVMRE